MRHIRPFNELKAETYLRTSKAIQSSSKDNVSNRRRALNMTTYARERAKIEAIENRKVFIEKYKKDGIFKFDIYYAQSEECEFYISFILTDFSKSNHSNDFYDNIHINIVGTPVDDDAFNRLYDYKNRNTSFVYTNGFFGLFDFELKLDLEAVDFKKYIEVDYALGSFKATAYDRATSNRIIKGVSKLFSGDDYIDINNISILDKINDEFLLDISSEYGIEMSHIKKMVDSLRPTLFMNL